MAISSVQLSELFLTVYYSCDKLGSWRSEFYLFYGSKLFYGFIFITDLGRFTDLTYFTDFSLLSCIFSSNFYNYGMDMSNLSYGNERQ